MGEIKTLLQEIVDENSTWHIIMNRGWGTDKLTVGVQRWTTHDRYDLRGQIAIHKDQGKQLRLTKDAQLMEEWTEMEKELKTDYEGRNPYNWKVDEKVRYTDKKETISDSDSARDLIKRWKQEAEEEIQREDFKSIVVSESLVE